MNNSRSYQKKLLLLLACAVACLPFNALAAEQDQEPGQVPTLPMVTVEATRLDPLIGASRLSREHIDNLPIRNRSVNELLSVLPGVQFDEEKDSSFRSGEIIPPNLSISGGRVNSNNFRIDGIENNSRLDPLYDFNTNPFNIPGHPQEIFISTDLIEEVTVYEHNIPARFGGFTGGVIDTRTKDPALRFEGKIRYRTTRDNWTKFHVAPEDAQDFNNSTSEDKQPRFDRQEVHGEANIPVDLTNRFLIGYDQSYSKIPLTLLNAGANQYRRSETFFLKYLRDISAAEVLRVSLLHTPYEGKHYLRNTKDSYFTLGNNATSATLSYKNEGLSGDTTLNASYHQSDDRRNAPQNLLRWKPEDGVGAPTSKDWGNLVGLDSLEGGLGDLARNQHNFELSADWHSTPIETSNAEHTINIGLQFEHINADMERNEDAFSYLTPVLQTNLTCAPDDIACETNEQFLSKRKIYNKSSVDILVSAYDFYLEDDIRVSRLELRSGVRYSYDDLMENHNLAPRLAASYDLFDNGSTLLISGWNRYFDRSNLTYKLRESILWQEQEVRTYDAASGTLSDWTPQLLISPLGDTFTSLKTPYTHEASLGIDQKLLGGHLLLEYVIRHFRDQLAKEIAPFDSSNPYALREVTLNNNGRKDYKSARLAWERRWSRHFLAVNLTWEEVKTNAESYDDTFGDADLLEQIWYNGKLLYLYELPREGYTRPWTANLIWEIKLPHHLSFTNTTKFRSSYRTLEDTKQNASDGNDIYGEVRTPASLTFDWRLAWDSTLSEQYGVSFAIDIYNVFNRKNRLYTTSNENPEYGLGRQFWAEISLTF